MSSMRNAVQRRNHRERAQPKQREKWGLLEKHKDYSLRAKDFNEKKKRLKILRQKAADRNPDEFHFAMMSSKTDSRGVKIADRGNIALSPEAVALLKTQDAGYLRTVAQKTRKAIERLQQHFTLEEQDAGDFVLRLGNQGGSNRHHISFMEDNAELQDWMDQRNSLSEAFADRLQNNPTDNDDYFDSDTSQDPDSKSHKTSTRQAEQEAKLARITRKQRQRNREIRQNTLAILQKRERDLRAAELQLEIQRSQMSSSQGIGVTKSGRKFRVRARKR